MSSIQKVAVIGASGSLGVAAVEELLNAGFSVTAITRVESKATFPDGVIVKRVNLDSFDSIKDTVSGHDAVVSTSAIEAAAATKLIIDAVIAAKVPRYIPSEFGIDTRKYRNLKIGALLMPKIRNVDYLIEVAQKHNWFSWTGIANGLFFDWTFKHGYHFIQPELRKFYIVDSGDEPFSTSTLNFVGKAIAAVLKMPAETANKYLNVAGMITTQSEVLRAVEEVTGSKYEISYLKSTDLEKIADEKIARNDHTGFMEYLQQFLFADGIGHALAPEDSANVLLGLEHEDLMEAVKKSLP
ncbi:hypothetical protein AUP68_16982 [Ilyonectria robusta]